MITDIERVNTPGWDYDIDISTSDQYLLRLHTEVCKITLSGYQTSPFKTEKFWLFLEQQNGAHKVDWPENIKWNMGHKPILSNQKNQIDMFEFVSIDRGNTWFGSFIGAGFKQLSATPNT